jgi:endonuclease/exonuclease/phosphatase family metal-dependent hydrolase
VKWVIDAVVSAMAGPPEALREAALQGLASPEAHDALVARIPALQAIEAAPPPHPAMPGARLRIAAWNAERCKYSSASAALIEATGADIVLLSEMDLGMARSGNRHTTQELAAALGMGHVFATEFVELDLGDDREKAWHAGQRNRDGLHGNAILSRLTLRAPARVALDEGAVWFRPGSYQEQQRIGGRCAVTALLDLPQGPVLLASLHLESHSTPADRAAQIARLLDAIAARHGELPALIAGDLNTAAVPRGADPHDATQPWFTEPVELEPLFAAAEAAGFDWRACNTPAPTERTRPDGAPRPPFRRIDWVLARGLLLSEPRVWPAVDASGAAISDHELLTIDLATEP